MKDVACSNCGAEVRPMRGSYRFRDSGLRDVVLHGVEILRCDQCGNEDPIIPRVNDLMRTLALAVIGKPYRLAGEEVRFLRKYLKMTGDEFSRLLHVDKTTLSKWENDEDPIGEQSDLLIRTLTMALGEGLKERLEEVVRDFAQIRESRRRVRIEVNSETMAYQYA